MDKLVLCEFCGLTHVESESEKCRILKNTMKSWINYGHLCEICGFLVLLKDPSNHIMNCERNKPMIKLPKNKTEHKISFLASMPLKSKMICPVKDCVQRFDLEEAFKEYHEHHHERWQLVNLNLTEIIVDKNSIEDESNVEFVEACNPILCKGCGNLYQYQKDLEKHYCPILKSKSMESKSGFRLKGSILCDSCGHFVDSTHFLGTCEVSIMTKSTEAKKDDTQLLSIPVNNPMKCPVKNCNQDLIFQHVLAHFHENHDLDQKVRQMTEDEPEIVENNNSLTATEKVRQIPHNCSKNNNNNDLTRKIPKENLCPKKPKTKKKVSKTFQTYCQFCKASFTSKGSLIRHINKKHPLNQITCGACFQNFSGERSFKRHVEQGCTIQHQSLKVY